MRLFVLLMMFVLSAGAKVGNIGCNLLKNERIYEALLQLNRENPPSAQDLKKL